MTWNIVLLPVFFPPCFYLNDSRQQAFEHCFVRFFNVFFLGLERISLHRVRGSTIHCHKVCFRKEEQNMKLKNLQVEIILARKSVSTIPFVCVCVCAVEGCFKLFKKFTVEFHFIEFIELQCKTSIKMEHTHTHTHGIIFNVEISNNI